MKPIVDTKGDLAGRDIVLWQEDAGLDAADQHAADGWNWLAALIGAGRRLMSDERCRRSAQHAAHASDPVDARPSSPTRFPHALAAPPAPQPPPC